MFSEQYRLTFLFIHAFRESIDQSERTVMLQDDPDEEKEAKDDEKKKEVAGPEELDDDEETDTKGIQSQV